MLLITKKVWNKHGDSFDHVPTDIMILKDDKNLEDFKSEVISKLKQLGFSPKISTVVGKHQF